MRQIIRKDYEWLLKIRSENCAKLGFLFARYRWFCLWWSFWFCEATNRFINRTFFSVHFYLTHFWTSIVSSNGVLTRVFHLHFSWWTFVLVQIDWWPGLYHLLCASQAPMTPMLVGLCQPIVAKAIKLSDHLVVVIICGDFW